MNLSYKNPTPSKNPATINPGLLVTVGSQVGGALIGIILIALLIGIGIDELLGLTKHPFTILLFLGSVPFSLIVTYWLATRATKNINQPKPAAQPAELVEEEEKRE